MKRIFFLLFAVVVSCGKKRNKFVFKSFQFDLIFQGLTNAQPSTFHTELFKSLREYNDFFLTRCGSAEAWKKAKVNFKINIFDLICQN